MSRIRAVPTHNVSFNSEFQDVLTSSEVNVICDETRCFFSPLKTIIPLPTKYVMTTIDYSSLPPHPEISEKIFNLYDISQHCHISHSSSLFKDNIYYYNV